MVDSAGGFLERPASFQSVYMTFECLNDLEWADSFCILLDIWVYD
jgi:hypothetical protein